MDQYYDLSKHSPVRPLCFSERWTYVVPLPVFRVIARWIPLDNKCTFSRLTNGLLSDVCKLLESRGKIKLRRYIDKKKSRMYFFWFYHHRKILFNRIAFSYTLSESQKREDLNKILSSKRNNVRQSSWSKC